jgi:hypothetical protein
LAFSRWTSVKRGLLLLAMLLAIGVRCQSIGRDGRAANAHKKTPAAVSGSRCFATLKS